MFSFAWARGEGESARDLRLAGLGMVGLLLVVTALWWIFR
jgi:predicted PilT family ATPase